MNTSLTTSQIEAMRRAAKKLVRDEGIIYGHALDRLANDHGYRNWSLLQKNGAPEGPQPYVFRRTDEEMAAALRVVPDPGRWDRRLRSDVALSLTKDIHDKFISAANAVDYAVAYVESLLRQKRFRIDSKAVASWEMRCWLPYGAHPVDGSTHILVNRKYKPVGTPSSDFARYEEFPHLHLQLEGEDWQKFARPGSSQPFLYNDGCLPWRNRQNATDYLARLRELRNLLS